MMFNLLFGSKPDERSEEVMPPTSAHGIISQSLGYRGPGHDKTFPRDALFGQ